MLYISNLTNDANTAALSDSEWQVRGVFGILMAMNIIRLLNNSTEQGHT